MQYTTYQYTYRNICVQNGRELGDVNVSLIHKHVTALKRSREWEIKYMRFDELLKKEKNVGYIQGHADGHAAGEADMLELITRMLAAGEADKVMHLSEDAKLLEMMREKYLTTKLRMMR